MLSFIIDLVSDIQWSPRHTYKGMLQAQLASNQTY